MDTRLVDHPAFRLIGHAARVPLIHEGVNPHIQEHIAALPLTEHARLKSLSETELAGLLQISDGLEPDATEGSELTYLHGVAVHQSTPVPEDLDAIEVPAGKWAVFRTDGPHPQAPCRQPGPRPPPSGSSPTRGACAPGSLDCRDPGSLPGLQHRHVRAVAPGRTGLTQGSQSGSALHRRSAGSHRCWLRSRRYRWRNEGHLRGIPTRRSPRSGWSTNPVG